MTGGIRLRVNPVACAGHGACAELLPELISLDEWGYPIVADTTLPAAPGAAGPARGGRLPRPGPPARAADDALTSAGADHRANSEAAQRDTRAGKAKIRG